MSNYSEVWELDSIYPGGSSSPELEEKFKQLTKKLDQFVQAVTNWSIPKNEKDTEELQKILALKNDLEKNFINIGAFLSCLASANVKDTKAVALSLKNTQLAARFQTVVDELTEKFSLIPNDIWQAILAQSAFQPIAYVLDEARTLRQQRGSREQEATINALEVDGYNAWSSHYDTIVDKVRIHVEIDGEQKDYSAGQALNLLNHPDPVVREKVFQAYKQAWQEQAELFADTINHLAGFRLATYKLRNWDDVLSEPLAISRMKRQTLDTMWDVITKHKATFVEFLNRKAQLMKLEKLSFADVEAPLVLTAKPKHYTYDEGATFIINHFEKFSPKMAAFAKNAFEKHWIEAENRDNKRPGGFCTDFPLKKESRIFMTYDGAPGTVATLAHELGHAFHSYVLRDEPYENTHYAMNVAETASTFAEMIIADASVKEAQTKEEKIMLLEDKIGRSVAFFMNIHARFLFETRFYEERKNGIVSADRLNVLMEEAQREAYVDSLSEYLPQFWASKLHFFIDDVPFYNFPYTFGYLFSLGIYNEAIKSGGSYEDRYIALLKDTGAMTTEELAQKHLGVDLTKPDFWEKTVQSSVQDVKEFLALTEDLIK